MSLICFVSALLFILGSSGILEARTWYINEAGTGDAPTIQAAMDSAAYGDTVLVGPGTYYGRILMTDGTVLKSASGPEVTILSSSPWDVVGFGPGVSGTLDGFTLVAASGSIHGAVACWEAIDFVIKDNVLTGNNVAGIMCEASARGEISGNTVVDNMGIGIWISLMSYDLNVHNNICVGNIWGGIQVRESEADFECNDCWGNGDFDYDIDISWDPYSNFTQDPLFCDREGGDFTLNSCSPCLPGNHPYGYDCGLIGALEQGCYSPSQAQRQSWGMVKALFR
jgi:parallel beta-helix repeat protein